MPTVINLVVGTIVSRPTIMVAWLPGIALLAYLLTNARAQNETTIYKRNDKKAGFVSGVCWVWFGHSRSLPHDGTVDGGAVTFDKSGGGGV